MSSKKTAFPKTLYVTRDEVGGEPDVYLAHTSLDEIDTEQEVAVYNFGTSGPLTISHVLAGQPVKQRHAR